jgi:hypothetical protein
MRRTKSQRGTEASRADKYELYLRSVQVAEHETMMFARFFRSVYGRPAKTLREDFCGTAAVCTEWVRGRSDRHAIGVDLDPEPLAWGMDNNVATLTPAARERVALVRGDVRTLASPPVEGGERTLPDVERPCRGRGGVDLDHRLTEDAGKVRLAPAQAHGHEMEIELQRLKAQYTDTHPDVLNMSRLVAEQRRKATAESAGMPDTRARADPQAGR